MNAVISILISLSVLATICHGYVAVPPGLPRHKQLQWLEKKTTQWRDTQLGRLTNEMLEESHDLVWGWSHFKNPNEECALQAESIVRRVIEEHSINEDAALPTLADYNCLLEGWARSKFGVAAAERCEQILVEMEATDNYKPNLTSFKATLMAWKEVSHQVPFASLRAKRILEWMIDLYESGENVDACPDADCFDTALQMWSRSGLDDAPERAEEMLGSMETLYERTLNLKVKPRTLSFNSVLAAWSKSDKRASGKRASDILLFMETLARSDESVVPNMVSYSLVVNSLKKHGMDAVAVDKVCNILEMVERGYRDGIDRFKPDTVFFNSILGSLSRVDRTTSGTYRRARSILVRQMRLYDDLHVACPDVYSFTSVLAACASETKQKEKAFQVAMQTFQQLRHSDQFGAPNHVTYGTMLKCCARLLPARSELRKKMTRKIWSMCTQDGLVGDMVLSRLRDAACCSETYHELLGKGHTRRNIPKSWTRNLDTAIESKFRNKVKNRKAKNGKTRRSAEV